MNVGFIVIYRHKRFIKCQISLLFLDVQLRNVLGSNGKPVPGIKKTQQIFLVSPFCGQTGVIKVISLYFTLCLQEYCLEYYKTSMEYSLGLLRLVIQLFAPFLFFEVNSVISNGSKF